MQLQYELKSGSYYLYDLGEAPSAVTGLRRFKLKTDLLAVAFDADTGELHQHGTPTRIQSWAMNQRRRLRAAGQLQKARGLVVISGPFPVEEINKCLRVDGYVRRMFERLASLPHGKLQIRPPASKSSTTAQQTRRTTSSSSGFGAGFASGFATRQSTGFDSAEFGREFASTYRPTPSHNAQQAASRGF